MIKTRSKEIMKVVAVSVLSIGIMSAAFIGINTQAFAGATNGGESMPLTSEYPITIEATATAEEIFAPVTASSVLYGFQEPTLTVVESQENNPSPNALSAERASLFGAMYIWDMFGESIDGTYVDMWYQVWPSHTRAYWFGHVAESREALMNSQFLYSFLVDAVTGERIDIMRVEITYRSDVVQAALNEQVLRGDYGRNVGGAGDTIFDAIFNLRENQQMPERLDEQAQIAKEIAQRHFTTSLVDNAEFISFGVAGLDLDESGNLIITSHILTFNVADGTGRIATVAFNEETGELFSLSTQMNDVIPGFGF